MWAAFLVNNNFYLTAFDFGLGMREMKVDKLDGFLRQARLRWFEHVWRRDDQYVGKQVMRMTVGRKERGRSKRRWKD